MNREARTFRSEDAFCSRLVGRSSMWLIKSELDLTLTIGAKRSKGTSLPSSVLEDELSKRGPFAVEEVMLWSSEEGRRLGTAGIRRDERGVPPISPLDGGGVFNNTLSVRAENSSPSVREEKPTPSLLDGNPSVRNEETASPSVSELSNTADKCPVANRELAWRSEASKSGICCGPRRLELVMFECFEKSSSKPFDETAVKELNIPVDMVMADTFDWRERLEGVRVSMTDRLPLPMVQGETNSWVGGTLTTRSVMVLWD